MKRSRREAHFVRRGGTRKRRYGIMRRVNGKLYGMIDASTISMGWSDRFIYLWEEPPVHYIPGKGQPNEGEFIVRMHSDTCPVGVNLKEPSHNRHRGRNYTFWEK